MSEVSTDTRVSNEASRRALLFSARLRFSSPVQPLREAAIDRIVQQNMALSAADDFWTAQNLCDQGAFSLPDGTQVVTVQQVNQSFRRMVAEGEVEGTDVAGFRLSPRIREPLERETERSQQLFARLIEKHLSGARGGVPGNSDVFLEAVALIFAELGEIYVRMILGELHEIEFARGPLVQRVLSGVDSRATECDVPAVKAAVVAFIEDLSPDAAHVKWNLAQNYYVAKALGLDQEGRVLSEEAFGDAEVFLDTNVVIPALEPLARHHKSFQSLATACRMLSARLSICQITVTETRSSISRQREVLAKVMDEVPEELEDRVSGDFFAILRRKMRRSEDVDLDELFAPYNAPAERLREKYGAELVDDPWFDDARDSQKVTALSAAVSEAWERRTGWPKAPAVALHDALLLAWIEKRRMQEPDKTIVLVTRDHTLPDVRRSDLDGPPPVMMLDAFIQWVSPLVLRESPNMDFSAIFAEAIRYELLPQENFFDPKDFLVFHEMEMSCKELPVEDVEACLRHLKKTMPVLDPRRAEDRERLTAEINRFLVSPGRRYKLDLERLEREKQELKRSAQQQLDAEHHDAQLQLHTKEQLLADQRRRIERFENSEREQREQNELRRTRQAAVRRLLVLATFVLAGWGIVAVSALNSAGPTDSVWETTVSMLPTAGTVLAVGIVAGWFLLGKKRIESLGWGFSKIFRN